MSRLLEIRHGQKSPAASVVRHIAPVAAGLAFVLLLAALLVTMARAGDAVDRLRSLGDHLKEERKAVDELQRTRYETEMRELHEVKVKLDYNLSVYQEDIRKKGR